MKKLLLVLAIAPSIALAKVTTAPVNAQDFRAYIVQAAKLSGLWHDPRIKNFLGQTDMAGYSVTIEYDPAFFSKDLWRGREQRFAFGDTLTFAQNFVRILVKNGHSPAADSDSADVHVCASMPGPLSLTGHKTTLNFGCSTYSPMTDDVSLNSNYPEADGQ